MISTRIAVSRWFVPKAACRVYPMVGIKPIAARRWATKWCHNMDAYSDQRVYDRFRCTATLGFSYFNKEEENDAQMLNYGHAGMCFQSKVALPPGVIVCIRLKNIPGSGACDVHGCGLRSLTLAETIWCREVPDDNATLYVTGVKYFQPG